MGLNTETLQNLIITDSNETLLSYTDKINRRLAVLANLGQRFGQEGQGFYIQSKKFKEIFNIPQLQYLNSEDPKLSKTRTCVLLALNHEDDDQNLELNSLSNLDSTRVLIQYNYDDTWNDWYDVNTQEDLSFEPLKVKYPPFFVNFFVYYAKFVLELYKNKYNEYFRKIWSETEGIEITENLSQCIVTFDNDSQFDIIYDSSTNLPVCFSQPYCISSNQFFSREFDPLFSSKFTVAVNVEDITVDPSINEEVGKFLVAEYGLGIKDTGEVLFNGIGSDIIIDGADGANAQVYILESAILQQRKNGTTKTEITSHRVYGPNGCKVYETLNNINLVDTYKNYTGEIVYYIEPDNLYFDGTNSYFCEGAVAFSFLTKQSQNIDGSIDDHTLSTILIYSNNTWLPLSNSADDISTIFTFQDLVDSSKIEKNIREKLAKYFSGEKPDENLEYFKHKQVIFNDSKLSYNKDLQYDAVYYRMPGNYVLNCETIVPTADYAQDFDSSIFNIQYKLAQVPEKLKEHRTITFEDMLLENQLTLKRNRPRLYYNQETYSESKVSYELPTIALNNTSLFMPSVVDEVRVYNIYDPASPKAGWTEDSPFGIPKSKLTGNCLEFGELEGDKNSLKYSPVAVGKMAEAWNTEIASQKNTNRYFEFSVKKEDTKFPLNIRVNNVFYEKINTLVLADDWYLEPEYGAKFVGNSEYNNRLQATKNTLEYHSYWDPCLSLIPDGPKVSPLSLLPDDKMFSKTSLSSTYLEFENRSEKLHEVKETLKLDVTGITTNRDFKVIFKSACENNTFITIQKRKFVAWSENDHQKNHHLQKDLVTKESDTDPGVGYWRFALCDLFLDDYVKFDSSDSGDVDILQNRTIEIAPNYNGVGRDEVYQVNLYEAYMRDYISKEDVVFDANRLVYFYYPCINNVPVSPKSSMWVEWNIK